MFTEWCRETHKNSQWHSVSPYVTHCTKLSGNSSSREASVPVWFLTCIENFNLIFANNYIFSTMKNDHEICTRTNETKPNNSLRKELLPIHYIINVSNSPNIDSKCKLFPWYLEGSPPPKHTRKTGAQHLLYVPASPWNLQIK